VASGLAVAERIQNQCGQEWLVSTDVSKEVDMQRMVEEAICSRPSRSSFIAQPHIVTYNATKTAVDNRLRLHGP
jgi:hypothetical protein